MIGVVLDTNVLVSANLNDEGLEAVVVSLALNKWPSKHMSSQASVSGQLNSAALARVRYS